MHRPRTKLITIVVLLVALLGSCATVPDGRSSAAPVISWPGDPARSIAISWHAPGGTTVEFAGPDEEVREVQASRTGRFATVRVTDLRPGTGYRYRVTGDERWHEFTTMEEEPERFAFALIGDLQPFNAETDRTTSLVMDKVASLDPRFALQVGDVTEIGISQASWRRALAVLSRLGAQTPIVATAGNHDYYYVVPSTRLFKSIFPAPYIASSPRRDTWYSTTVGPLHIAVLDTEADGEAFDRQMDWLKADLYRARAAGIPWVFVAMHRPILGTTTGADDPRWAQALFPLIARHSVDAVFWGHHHAFEHYEYTYGADGMVLTEGDRPATSPVHMFTTGSAGARVDALYTGFFTHRPFDEERVWYSVETGEAITRSFTQYPWRRDRVLTEGPGVRYQDPAVYPDAASYYSFPFESAADEEARRYSTDPTVRYSEDAELFGYTYGETSMHYLWIEVTADRCTISAHYADGEPGEQGTLMTTPTGAPLRWELTR